jgi:hypothetical protein
MRGLARWFARWPHQVWGLAMLLWIAYAVAWQTAPDHLRRPPPRFSSELVFSAPPSGELRDLWMARRTYDRRWRSVAGTSRLEREYALRDASRERLLTVPPASEELDGAAFVSDSWDGPHVFTLVGSELTFRRLTGDRLVTPDYDHAPPDELGTVCTRFTVEEDDSDTLHDYRLVLAPATPSGE